MYWLHLVYYVILVLHRPLFIERFGFNTMLNIYLRIKYKREKGERREREGAEAHMGYILCIEYVTEVFLIGNRSVLYKKCKAPRSTSEVYTETPSKSKTRKTKEDPKPTKQPKTNKTLNPATQTPKELTKSHKTNPTSHQTRPTPSCLYCNWSPHN
jgi:hypothetical protein